MESKLIFWTKWLQVMGIFLITFGVLLSFTPFMEWTLGQMYYDNYFSIEKYTQISVGDLKFQRFVYGATGGLLMCWGITIYFLTKHGITNGLKWTWKALLFSTFGWFIGDSYISLATGFEIHALMNLLILIPIVLPLVQTKEHCVK